jgi:hypothetical protein
LWTTVGFAAMAVSCAARLSPGSAIEVRTDDVDRFFAVYEAAGGRPTGEQLQREYLDRGTDGLRHLARVRNVTGERIAEAVATDPALTQPNQNPRGCAT